MQPSARERLARVAVALFFGLVFVRFAHPLADGDLWWHLNTGRWIVEHRGLPDADPFTFTVTPEFADRARMFVRSNWLAQVLYYGAFAGGGFQSLRLLNAALFTASALVVYRVCRRAGLERPWAVLFTTPFVAFAWHYDELRPFGFSVLLTAGFLLCIARAEGLEDVPAGRALAPLVPLAVLWANLHRGFAILFLLLVPSAVVWALRGKRRQAAWLVSTGFATLLNPGGIKPLVSALEESLQGTSIFRVMELARPWEFAAAAPEAGSYLPLLTLLLLGSLALMVVARRSLRAEDVFTYVLFAAAGLTAFRYSIYFVIVALTVASRYAAPLLAKAPDRLWRAGAAGALLATVALAATSGPLMSAPVFNSGAPREAVQALLRSGLPAPLLNTFDWGGYIAWTTGPRYRVFTDSRLLDFTVMKKLERVGGERQLLEEYGINTAIWPSLDRKTLRVPRLVLDLLEDPGWRLAHFDPVAVVFVRRSAAPAVPEASRSGLAQALLDVVRYRAARAGGWSAEDLHAATVLQAVVGEGTKEGENRGQPPEIP